MEKLFLPKAVSLNRGGTNEQNLSACFWFEQLLMESEDTAVG